MEQNNPVEALFDRAKAAGVPMSDVCEKAGVAQSTPSRWRNDHNSANVATLEKLNEALSDIIAARKEAA